MPTCSAYMQQAAWRNGPNNTNIFTPNFVCCSAPLQSLYRGHTSHVVFLGFLSDASLISLDAAGCLAQWPASAADRCGFGWLTPRKLWQLPHSTRTCQPRCVMAVVWFVTERF
jgi:hypothetical protein